jgi:hypothetical protein
MAPTDFGGYVRMKTSGACVFDGQSFWVVQSDSIARHFAVHALDLQTLTITHSLASGYSQILGLAWDQDHQEFWISTIDGSVYPVDPKKALANGKLEDGLGRQFQGDYNSLA